ncbi:MAG: aminotransferase class I/II-fold pyridoxal phosphate-dependent enzyme [Candidatus Saccharimonadales bacterium]
MSETLVPTFDLVEDLRIALGAKDTFGSVDLYPRDGTKQLWETEGRCGELVGVDEGDLILCASGMAAITGTIGSLVKAGDTFAIAEQTYSQTQMYADKLRQFGVDVIRFDSGSPTAVERLISRRRPDLIFTETVSNGPDMPVTDIRHLISVCDDQQYEPIILLDNTLPLSTGFDVTPLLSERQNVLVVESATKSYALNQELAGLVYGKNRALLNTIRRVRRTEGFGLNVAALQRLDTVLPASPDVFHARNRRIFEASAFIAQTLAHSQGAGEAFVVSHPALDTHPNNQFARTALENGSAPVCYVQSLGQEGDQYRIAQCLWSHSGVREQAELGQSFAFDTARILPDSKAPVVRIAAGAKGDYRLLASSMAEALRSL